MIQDLYGEISHLRVRKRYRSENLIARAKMAFLPMDLSFLRAGGRLSSIKYATSQVLNIRPVVEMRDGALSMTRKFHGSTKRVATKFLEAFLSDGAIDRQQLILLYSCGLPSKICEAVTERAKNLGVQEVQLGANGMRGHSALRPKRDWFRCAAKRIERSDLRQWLMSFRF